ncbi:hypothetical protein [Delftia acidovorans]|uniref:hypothetical protein n=1 Tax=Delftia acidovorans TaxID=80866 RepID=UPI0022AB6F1D|nr:hypothetical protein [Delftia acidovorans]WAT83479.1 hypothetical protein O1V13_18690 [Delftia acidovorans]WAT84376.1 hypothetical protein O1V13_23510 [Delftia acidovorans]
MKKGTLELLIIGLAKAGGLFIAFYSIVFISIQGGVSELGKFSAVTSILAPLVMFVTFRYVEFINAAADKFKAFSEIFWVGGCLYAIAAVLVGLFLWVYDSMGIAFYIFALVAIYKIFELFNDLLTTTLFAVGQKRLAISVIAAKVLAIVVLSIVWHWLVGLSALNTMCAALVSGFIGCFLLIDLPICVRYHLMHKTNFSEMMNFIKKNIGLGFFNLLISLNSTLPRYYILYFGDFYQLGLYTLIYQISATAVNIVQYPISVKVEAIAKIFRVRPGVEWRLFLGQFFGVALLLAGGFLSQSLPIVYAGLASLAMFVGLSIRGIFITACLGLGVVRDYVQTLVISILAGVVFLAVFELIHFDGSRLLLSFIYVLISSAVTSLILIKRIHSNARVA